MGLTAEDLKILSEPVDEKTIGVKVQSFLKDRTKAMLVAYLQHTDVYARLEKVDPNWSSEVTGTERVSNSVFVRVKLTLKGISRENAGEGDDLKSATSDAIKRAAMLFGVGRYLYDQDKVWVPYNERSDQNRVFTYEDYQKGLKQGQSPLPVSEAEKPKSKAEPAVKPNVTPFRTPKAEPAPKRLSRGQLEAGIFKTAEALGLTSEDLGNWIWEDFRKKAKELTTEEVQKLFDSLQHELGRKGVS